MNSSILSLSLTTLLLTACTSGRNPSITLEEYLENPLFTEQYADMLIDRLVEMEIDKDPVLEDVSKKSVIDSTRRDWLEKSREARKRQNEGVSGHFVSALEYTNGETLFVQDTLYLGPTFHADPGVDLHLYLTAVVDPRESPFPDPTALHIGLLMNPFGASTYEVPKVEDAEKFRTVVLFDRKLERIHGFAQLN